MAEQEFKIGDVVTLKSGSPEMTINSDYYGSWTCYWFIDGKENSGTYDPKALELVNKE